MCFGRRCRNSVKTATQDEFYVLGLQKMKVIILIVSIQIVLFLTRVFIRQNLTPIFSFLIETNLIDQDRYP